MPNFNFSSVLSSSHLAIQTLTEYIDGQIDQAANNLFANASHLSVGNSSVSTYITPQNIDTPSILIGDASSNITANSTALQISSFGGSNTYIDAYQASFSGLLQAQNGLYVTNGLTADFVFANSSSGNTGDVLASGTSGVYWANSVNNALHFDGAPSSAYVNTSGNYAISGIHFHFANVIVGNTSVNATMFANSTNVFFTGISYTANDTLHFNGLTADQYAYSNVIPTLQTTTGLTANVAKLNSNNAGYLGGIAASQYAYANVIPTLQTTTGLAANVANLNANNAYHLGGYNADQYAFANVIPTLQTTAGLAANVAQLDSNNALYLNGVAANQYAFANSVQTTAGLAANVAQLNSNNALYLNGVAANQYAFANVIPTLQTTAGLAANVAKLTANNSAYFNNLAPYNYPTTFGNYLITGVYRHAANVHLLGALVANSLPGTTGQVLAADASGNVFWQTTNGQSISVANLAVTGPIFANNFIGNKGLVLTSNGNGVYWSDVTNASGGIFDGGSPLSSYINNPRLDAGGVY
jgi:hypothetical protein